MSISNLINELEKVKEAIERKHIIKALEHYTEHLTNDTTEEDKLKNTKLANDLKKKEEERTLQDDKAKLTAEEEKKAQEKKAEDDKKAEDEKKTDAEKKADADKKKEEDKKKTDANKFENNMMDTLKWVFIGIGIFSFIIIVLSLIYWFMFSGNNEGNKEIAPTYNEANNYNEANEMNNANEGSLFSFISQQNNNPAYGVQPTVAPVAPAYSLYSSSGAPTSPVGYVDPVAAVAPVAPATPAYSLYSSSAVPTSQTVAPDIAPTAPAYSSSTFVDPNVVSANKIYEDDDDKEEEDEGEEEEDEEIDNNEKLVQSNTLVQQK